MGLGRAGGRSWCGILDNKNYYPYAIQLAKSIPIVAFTYRLPVWLRVAAKFKLANAYIGNVNFKLRPSAEISAEPRDRSSDLVRIKGPTTRKRLQH